MPTVSIIMPCFNNELYLNDSISSVLNQTYTDWELLIVDDCSTDNTWQLLEQWAAKDERFKLLRTAQNSGSGVARNIGIEKAQGQYIAFLDSDDWWYPLKLETMLQFMTQRQCDFACSWYEYADSELKPYYAYRPHDKQDFRYMVSGNDVGTPGVIYNAQNLGKVYMPNFRRGQDWGLWLRILQKTDYLYVCPKILFKYRLNTQSVTRNKRRMIEAVINIYENELGFSPLKAWLVFVFRFTPRYFAKLIRRHLHQQR